MLGSYRRKLFANDSQPNDEKLVGVVRGSMLKEKPGKRYTSLPKFHQFYNGLCGHHRRKTG